MQLQNTLHISRPTELSSVSATRHTSLTKHAVITGVIIHFLLQYLYVYAYKMTVQAILERVSQLHYL